MSPGRSLHRFFARLPTLGSSSGSEHLHGCEISATERSTSESLVPYTTEMSSKSGGQLVCNVPRHRREDRQAKKRRRSNSAVVPLEPRRSINRRHR